MQLTPVVCDNPKCGAIWGVAIVKAGPGSHISFTNSTVSPCPKCGGVGHIPDGVYSWVGDVLQVITAPKHSRAELELILEILRRAREKHSSREDVAAEIQKVAPSFSKLADFLPKTPADLAAYLTFGAAIVAIVLQSSQPQSVTVNQVINQITITAPPAPTAREAKRQAPQPQVTERPKYKKEKRRQKKGDRRAARGE